MASKEQVAREGVILARDIIEANLDPKVLFDLAYNLSLELVVSGIVLGGVIGAVFFMRIKRPLKHRAVIGAFLGFYLSIVVVVALFFFAEAYKFLSM